MPAKASPDEILAAFKKLGKDPSSQALSTFVSQNFEAVGSDMLPWTPPDFPAVLPFAQNISNSSVRAWAQAVHEIWPTLGRQSADDAQRYPDRHSLLYTPHGLVVPGGRFREMYYWDTYFILMGLLRSGMSTTANGILKNMLYLVDKFGFVPNGLRAYYLTRSQPPLLTAMVELYVNTTGDTEFLEEALPLLLKEQDFWRSEYKLIQMPDKSLLNRYHANTDNPRPESYAEDVKTAQADQARSSEIVYRELASGAETGWDFSTRWLSSLNMSSIQTTHVVPCDLNAILYHAEVTLDRLGTKVGKPQPALQVRAAARAASMNRYMWDVTTSRWNDIVDSVQAAESVTPAGWMPLWAGIAPPDNDVDKSVAAFNESGLLQAGGIMTSLVPSGQQWDAPNAWAPLQWFVVEGVRRANTPAAQALADSIVCRWLKSMYEAYTKTGYMYEKYDALVPGQGGGGGEYVPQRGFGWTNGVMLAWLEDVALGKVQCDIM